MKVDHIFIFSEHKGGEAEALLQLGMIEGSSRRHPGQGTVNRKFYFNNFFLELLWVVDEQEIRQSPTKETQLWERSTFRSNHMSRFGLGLVNTKDTDRLFDNSFGY